MEGPGEKNSLLSTLKKTIYAKDFWNIVYLH